MYPVTSSGRKTSDTAILASAGTLHSVILEGDGTNACSVIIYDNASAASGTVLAKVLLPASGDTFTQFSLDRGVVALNGLYLDITGTGAAAIVHYSVG